MKHSEMYDKHADRRKMGSKPKKLKEGKDLEARARRVSFKNYVRELEDELLEQDLETGDEVVE